MVDKELIIPAAGRILISKPSLDDFYFGKSVVLLAEHNEEGSFGVIVNKPMNAGLQDAIEGFRDFNPPLFFGGPVETDTMFFIHSLGLVVPGAQKIREGLYWGGDPDKIREMVILNQIKPGEIRFFLGYSGWSADQLDQEINRDSWIVSEARSERIFNTKPEEMWSSAMKSLGKDYAIWANLPSDPELN
jgi:putative transcriptional regulator